MNKLKEFFRYFIVGGLSFVIDFSILVLLREIIFNNATTEYAITSTIIAFIIAFLFNYIASLKFVFITYKSANHKKDMILTLLIAVTGLIITILLMYLGEFILLISYIPSKIIVTALVLIWNYLARKYFVFNNN